MRKAVLAVLTMIVASNAAAMTEASHIFSSDITINGIPIASGNSFTDPLITVEEGDPITFAFELFGSPGQFNVTFISDMGSTLPPLASESFSYSGGATQSSPFPFSFVRTYASAGTFDGWLQPDFPASTPNYQYPGGNITTAPSIPFKIQVNSASAVPEPSSLTLLGTGLVGLVGFARRRRNRTAA